MGHEQWVAVNPWRRDDWGAVLFNPPDLLNARSGLCLTTENHVAFFWGAMLLLGGLIVTLVFINAHKSDLPHTEEAMAPVA